MSGNAVEIILSNDNQPSIFTMKFSGSGKHVVYLSAKELCFEVVEKEPMYVNLS